MAEKLVIPREYPKHTCRRLFKITGYLVINNVTKKNMDVTKAINTDVNTLVKGLKSLSKDAEEQLFEGRRGAAGPGNFSLSL